MTPFQRRLSVALLIAFGLGLGVLGIVLIPARYSGWVAAACIVALLMLNVTGRRRRRLRSS